MHNVTELFVLINATWSALSVQNLPLDPITERIARQVDDAIFGGGCPLNCCEAPETALAYTGEDGDSIPYVCKEARQIKKCVNDWGTNKDVCIDIITDSKAAARRHNKSLIKNANEVKRDALHARLEFLFDDLHEAMVAYNMFAAYNMQDVNVDSDDLPPSDDSLHWNVPSGSGKDMITTTSNTPT